MPDCRYCDDAFEDDGEFADHLATAHEWEELSRIDRKRIEVLLPEAVPDDEAEPRLRLDDTTDLDTLLDQEPTTDVIEQALAEYDRLIRQAEQEDEHSHANDLFWDYYEPLATSLDAVVTAEGWPMLADLMDAYTPQDDARGSPATSVIGNAIGRYLVRTRLADGVEALPEEGLAYLFALQVNDTDTGWEEAAAYSWGIGHPEQSVSDRIHAAARDDIYWATSALEHAFYANQHAACDCLARIARDEEVTNMRYLFSCVSAHSREYWPAAPRYWDWEENVEIIFEWDEEVVSRIRDLVAEVGIERDLPDEWSLSDLAV
jgi:hypothetical protein